MSLHYDEKGKFFTDYITKETVKAIIQTPTNRIEGTVYIRPGERVSDMLNRSEQFLPLTEVAIYDLTGQKVYEGNFIALNINYVIWLKPEEGKNLESEAS